MWVSRTLNHLSAHLLWDVKINYMWLNLNGERPILEFLSMIIDLTVALKILLESFGLWGRTGGLARDV
jgi:hypothetical protein